VSTAPTIEALGGGCGGPTVGGGIAMRLRGDGITEAASGHQTRSEGQS
jgi:hypothetical protein